MDHILLTKDRICVEKINDLVASEDCGAISMFIGTTRDNFDGKKVVRLEYEAYEPMAIKAMQNICTNIRAKWSDIKHIAIYHRLGCVPVKEASVVIAISSAHRADSLAAVASCIDELKATVPIWKKEIYAGEEEKGTWKENSECNANTTELITKRIVETAPIDKNLIQINVSGDELQRRIQSFIERKREQVNVSNIQDFIKPLDEIKEGEWDEDESCARVRTLFTKRKDSKGHVKVHKVNNEWGPQTIREPATTPQKQERPSLPVGVQERFVNIERYLRMGPVDPDIYTRLKVMEDRIAQLQALSPEYAQFWIAPSQQSSLDRDRSPKTPSKLQYLFNADDIAKKIKEMEKQTSIES